MTLAECREIIAKAITESATELDLSSRTLEELPAEIGRLQNLRKLNLSNNFLTDLPPEVANVTNLTSLDLSYNRLTDFPPAIARCTKLTSLDLRNNKLKELPQEMGRLKDLTSLNLAQNKLTEVPPEFARLANLTSLSLYQNRLSSLPRFITQLSDLRTLDLRGNGGLRIPPEILENYYYDAQPILRYVHALLTEESKRPLNEGRLMLVGEGGVGKTSLVKMLVQGRSDPNEKITEGINIQRWAIDIKGETVHLNIWDFGGQEIYHATHQFFLTKRTLYLLVLDARKGETHGRLDYWLKIIESYAGDSPVIVVSNKSDEHLLELNRRDLERRYPNRIRAFVDTTCSGELKGKPGQNGIDALKKHIKQTLARLGHIRDPLPTPWFDVKQQLEEMKENYIPERRYARMCEDAGIRDHQDQDLLLGYLNDLGVVLTFQDDRTLRGTTVLNPDWVTQGVYLILNSGELLHGQGVLKRGQLANILDPADYPQDKHDFLIGMLLKFELCFELPGLNGEYLFPDLLRNLEPYLDWDDQDSLGFEYHYDTLPRSVISRFITRTSVFQPDKARIYWRSGVVLDIEGNRARIRADYGASPKIEVSVIGESAGRRRALSVIRSNFEHIHGSLPGLRVEEKLPIPGQTCKPVDYHYLLKLERLGVKTFLPEGGDAQVGVADLLGTVTVPTSPARSPSVLSGTRERLRTTRVSQSSYLAGKQARMKTSDL